MISYQNFLRQERESFEFLKKNKVIDVEIWSFAIKEVECIAMHQYCDKHGNNEMENIRRAVEVQHSKELQM